MRRDQDPVHLLAAIRPAHRVDDPEHGGGGVGAASDVESDFGTVVERWAAVSGEEPVHFDQHLRWLNDRLPDLVAVHGLGWRSR